MALSIGDITDNVRKALKYDEEFQLQVQERLGLDLFYSSDVFTCKVFGFLSLVYVNTDNDGLIDVRVFDVGNEWFKETIMDWKEVIELWNGLGERKIKEVFCKEECLKCGFRTVCLEINKRN